MLHRFFGGIHPIEHKDLTEQKAAIPLPEAPARVVIPLSMNGGSPCKPLVGEGEKVKVGQLIAQGQGADGPIHASVSGRVSAVEERSYGGGGTMLSVVIDNDFQDTPCPDGKRRSSAAGLTGNELRKLIRDAGIVGMGGEGTPIFAKLESGAGKVDTLILNGCECEPYVTSDYRLMVERGEAVIGGARLLAKALGVKKTVIAVEADKPDALELLRTQAGGEEELRIQPLPTRYPQGAERQLIQTLLGRKIPSGKLPVEAGCLIFNVHTAAAVWDAVMEGKPLTRRYVTVTGGALREPMNLIVPVGTPVSWLIKLAGGFQTPPDRVLLGGPMLGTALYDLDVPVMKTTNCVLCLTGDEVGKQDPAQSCIRCGKCLEVCPMKLAPLFVRMNVEKRHWEAAGKLHVMDCIECGCCSYICPARLPLVQSFRMAKAALREESGNRTKAEKDREKEGTAE